MGNLLARKPEGSCSCEGHPSAVEVDSNTEQEFHELLVDSLVPSLVQLEEVGVRINYFGLSKLMGSRRETDLSDDELISIWNTLQVENNKTPQLVSLENNAFNMRSVITSEGQDWKAFLVALNRIRFIPYVDITRRADIPESDSNQYVVDLVASLDAIIESDSLISKVSGASSFVETLKVLAEEQIIGLDPDKLSYKDDFFLFYSEARNSLSEVRQWLSDKELNIKDDIALEEFILEEVNRYKAQKILDKLTPVGEINLPRNATQIRGGVEMTIKEDYVGQILQDTSHVEQEDMQVLTRNLQNLVTLLVMGAKNWKAREYLKLLGLISNRELLLESLALNGREDPAEVVRYITRDSDATLAMFPDIDIQRELGKLIILINCEICNQGLEIGNTWSCSGSLHQIVNEGKKTAESLNLL